MGSDEPKQFANLAGRSVLAHTLAAFDEARSIDWIVVVGHADQMDRCREVARQAVRRKAVEVVPGGKERQNSVAEGLKALGRDVEVVAIHDAARPLVKPDEIDAVVSAARESGAAVLGQPVTDTIKEVDGDLVQQTLDRSRLRSVQTPQAFRTELIRQAHAEADRTGYLGTDDTVLVERLGHPVRVVAGSRDNLKITTPEDLEIAEDILRRRDEGLDRSFRIGQGYDAHRLVEGRRLVLGGVDVPFERGLMGHSDADVLSHAIVDAVLGGLAAGDIGTLFPDSDPEHKDASSLVFLQRVAKVVDGASGEIVNVDATVLAQRPKLAPFIPEMRSNIAGALGIPSERVSVKATTTEEMGPVGRGEGMEAQAVVLLRIPGNESGKMQNAK